MFRMTTWECSNAKYCYIRQSDNSSVKGVVVDINKSKNKLKLFFNLPSLFNQLSGKTHDCPR